MLEAAILLFIASSVWFISRRWNKVPALPGARDAGRSLSSLAEGGLYQLASPHENRRLQAFRNLHLLDTGLSWQDNLSQQSQVIDFSEIQWVSAISQPQEGIAEMSLHLEIDKRWRILILQMPEAEMLLLGRLLQQIIPASRLNLGRPAAHPIGPLAARIAEDSLQGESSLGEEISLYLLPQILIVLKGDMVKAKLDTSSIRRVLAVEKLSGRLDSLLKPALSDGVVRLYSLYETAAFALPQYRELAEEISFLARCPLEYISQEDKSSKS
jgi:hypothetical protein